MTDTDLWVYDANFNALPSYGNDDDPVLQTTRSTLTRSYAPGRYYLALTDGNFANDERAAADDGIQAEPVFDYPDVASSSSLDPSADLSFSITDGLNTVPIDAIKLGAFDVMWYAFEVGIGQSIQGYCDATSTCPCGNDSLAPRGDGCVNSTGRGGLLYASGTTSLAADDLSFHALGLPAATSALLFAGNVALDPGFAFGDGLQCVGGSVRRLEVLAADGQGKASWQAIVGPAGFAPGATGYFQVRYRDHAGPCGQLFNYTNAVQVLFAP